MAGLELTDDGLEALVNAFYARVRADEPGAESPDYRRDSKWERVHLPHTWNTKDVFDDVIRGVQHDGSPLRGSRGGGDPLQR